MKFIKLYKNFKIISTCKNYDIKNYTINKDGTVDVDDHINLYSKKLIKLPLKFGNVSGDFDFERNLLTTLEGVPKSVGGYFNCMNNKLSILKGCPKSVGGSFYCSKNKLTTLEGCSQSVGGNFYCGENKLTTLDCCPQSVGGSFYCNANQLTTLKGCPQSVGSFDCSSNYLTTLEGCPKWIGGNEFHCSSNRLKDLYGFPELFDGYVYYHNNPVSEILDLFDVGLIDGVGNRIGNRIGKVIDLLNEYGVIQQDGKVVILDRLEEIFYTLNMEIPKEIKLKNYEVY